MAGEDLQLLLLLFVKIGYFYRENCLQNQKNMVQLISLGFTNGR